MANHTELLQEISFDVIRFFSEIFLPNIDQIESRQRDTLVSFAVLREDRKLDSLLSGVPCIPVTPNGKNLKCVTDLVHPNGKASKLYTNEDGRFPYKIFSGGKLIERLQSMGMQKDQISWQDLIDRARTVKDTFSKSSNSGLTRTKVLYDLLDHKLQTHYDPEKVQLLRCIEFVTVMEKPHKYHVKWATDGQHLIMSPEQLYHPQLVNLVSASEPIADITLMSTSVAEALKFQNNATLHQVTCQFRAAIDVKTGYVPDLQLLIFPLYEFLEKELGTDTDVTSVISEIQQLPCVLVHETLVEPRYVSMNDTVNCRPYLYTLPYHLKHRYSRLMNALGIHEIFKVEDFIKALERLSSKWKKIPLSEKELQATLHLLDALSKTMHTEGLLHEELKNTVGEIYAPNAKGILYPSTTLCHDDCPWIKRGDWNFLHHDVPLHSARVLGVGTRREKILDEHSYGLPFGQKGSLTKSLKRNLPNFASHVDVLKELIQNADDAGATLVHFVRDTQSHQTSHLFGESWKQLQGPSLCVYNNGPFTESDIEGIQKFGEGSKQNDPCKTGQYGVGFSSVYHLTDVPSIMTFSAGRGQTLCVFDPHHKYVPGATQAEPGRKYNRIDELGNKFPDVFSCYHQDMFDQENGCVIRLPLRDENMARNSEISENVITPESIWDIFKALKQQILDMLIFVNNIEEIKLSDIGSSGKLELVYSARISMSECDKQSRQEFAEETHKYGGKLREQTTTLSDIPQSKYVYNLSLTDSNNTTKDICVAQTLGFRKGVEIPDDILEAFSEGHLTLMPRGGVACCLNKKGLPIRTTGKVYCFLPLGIKSKLPVHVNAHFALGYENRREVWHKKNLEKYKYSWNELLCRTVLAESYACLLDETKSYVVSALHQGIDDISLSLKTVSDYVSCFPNFVESKEAWRWQCLVSGVYEIITNEELKIFPVMNKTVNVNAVEWYAATDTTAFFCYTDSENESDSTQSSKEKQPMGLRELLQTCSVKIIEVPDEIVQSLRELLLLNNFITPENTIKILQSHEAENPQCIIGHLPKKLEETSFKNSVHLNTVIAFCAETEDFISKLNGLPICLTGNNMLKVFDISNPVLEPTYASMFPEQSDKFLSSNVWKHFSKGTESGCVVPFEKLGLPMFADLIQEEFPQLENTVSITWSKQKFGNTNRENGIPMPFWINQCWRLMEKVLRAVSSESGEDRLRKEVSVLGQICLIPVTVVHNERHTAFVDWPYSQRTETLLFPLDRAEEICYHEKHSLDFNVDTLKECVESFGVPQLDISVFENFNENQLNSLKCLVTTLESPSKVVKLLYSASCANPSRSMPSSSTRDDFLLRYFQKHIKHMEDHKSYLAQLPLFQTVSGDHVSLHQYKARYTIPGEIPRDGLDFIYLNQNQHILFLEEKPKLVDLYTFLGCYQNTVVELYSTFIFPHFEYFTDAQRKKHLHYLYDTHLKHSELTAAAENLLQIMRNEALFEDIEGQLCVASAFSDPRNALFQLMLGLSDFPPPLKKGDIFKSRTWHHLLEIIGMKTEVSKAQFVKFAQQISYIGERAKSNTEVENVQVMSTTLVKYLFRDEYRKNDILKSIKDIKFLIQPSVSTQMAHVHQQFSENSTPGLDMIAFHNSVPDRFSKLVWTSANLLSHKYQPYLMGRNGEQPYSQLGVVHEPGVSTVIEHLLNLCDQFPNITDRKQKSLLVDVFGEIYKYFGTRQVQRHILEKESIVLIKEGAALIRADQMTDNLMERDEIHPYLYKVPMSLGMHIDFFKAIGTTHESTAQQYAVVLQSIHSKMNNRQLPPNYIDMVFRAIRGFFEAVQRSAADDVEKLFLPNEAGYLHESTELVFNDSPAFYQRIKRKSLPFVVDLRDCGLYAQHSDEIFHNLPKHLQPRLLSEVVSERLTENSKSLSGDSEIAVALEERIRAAEFLKAVKRLVKHEGKAKRVTVKAAKLGQILDHLSVTRVRSVPNLRTELLVKDNVLPNSERSKLCCLEKVQDSRILHSRWVIYINDVDGMENDILIPVSELLNEILQWKLGNSVIYLMSILKCDPSEIESKLDSLNIGLDQTQSISNVSLAIALGSQVYDDWPLQNGCPDFEIGEIAAYNKGQRKIHVRIMSNNGGGRYTVNDGLGQLTVGFKSLSKFAL